MDAEASASIDNNINYESEIANLTELKKAVHNVTLALIEKTNAIKAEDSQMDVSVNSEIAKLIELEAKIDQIKLKFSTGIINEDGLNSVRVELIPNADNFQQEANVLLNTIDLEKRVNLVVENKDALDVDISEKKEQYIYFIA